MNYLVNGSQIINFYTYNKLDYDFMDKTYYIGMKYPYKWYEFIHNIIHNKKITYFKDTTMIVSLLALDIHQIRILFEVLKEYLKDRLLKKVLYYREFIIVHFHNNKTINILKTKYVWMALFTYYMIKEHLTNIDVYFQGYIEVKDEKEFIDLIINHNNTIYLITTNTILENRYSNIKLFFLSDRLVNHRLLPEYYSSIKFSLNQNDLINEIINFVL